MTADVIAWPGEAAGPVQWKLWPLAFAVTGHADARVRAVIGRWDGPPIAGRSSRVLRLAPRRARHP